VAAADTVRVTTKRVAMEAASLTCVATFPRGDDRQGPARDQARKGFFGETEMAVFVLDKKKQPLDPCSEKRARLLLDRGRAVVARMYPFTIRLKDRVGGVTKPVALKIDPGGRTNGIAGA